MLPRPSLPELYARLAEAALDAGRADAAGELLRLAAVAGSDPVPNDPAASHAAGIKFLGAKDSRAESTLRAAVRAVPTDAVRHDHLGIALAFQNRFAEAEATFRLARRLNPQLASAARNLAQSLVDQKRWPEAAEAYREALALDPNDEPTRSQFTVALAECGRSEEAIEVLREYLQTHPNDAAVWTRLGMLAVTAARLDDAVEAFQNQVRIQPESAAAHANLAAAYGRLKRYPEAATAAREAIRLDASHTPGWVNLGNALRDLGELQPAIEALRKAIELAPDHPDAHNNLGLSYSMLGDWQSGLPHFDRAVAQNAKHGEYRFNRAIGLLTVGDFERGWTEYEWRWQTDQMKASRPRFPAPLWNGEDLRGRVIQLHTEQGLGDAIQFSRYVPLVAARGATVILSCPQPLKTLFRSLPGVAHVFGKGDPIPAYDVQCPLMSLPRILGTRLDTIPSATPYLTVPAWALDKGRERLAGLDGFKVGIVWQGNPKNAGDRWRSVPLSRFAALAKIPGISLVSLQHGPGVEQLADPGFPILDVGSKLGPDLAELAGVQAHLDLLVSVDTAGVHLAGACGRPVWVAISLNSDWRWLRDRTDSPWYPSMRLYRQSTFADWAPVFDRIADDLRKGR